MDGAGIHLRVRTIGFVAPVYTSEVHFIVNVAAVYTSVKYGLVYDCSVYTIELIGKSQQPWRYTLLESNAC